MPGRRPERFVDNPARGWVNRRAWQEARDAQVTSEFCWDTGGVQFCWSWPLGAVAQGHRGFVPKEGFVPDEKTAVRVAEAILFGIYGDDKIAAERPFTANLKDGVWTVEGHLSEGTDGGVARIKMSKRTAEVLFVEHGR